MRHAVIEAEGMLATDEASPVASDPGTPR
jgi:hypothetical protein